MTNRKPEIQIENLEDCIRIQNIQYAGKYRTIEWDKRIITAPEEADKEAVIPDFPLYAATWNSLYQAEKNGQIEIGQAIYFVREHLPQNFPNLQWQDRPGRRIITSTYFKVDSIHQLRSKRERTYQVKGQFIHSICKQKIPVTVNVRDSYEHTWEDDLCRILAGIDSPQARRTIRKTGFKLYFNDLRSNLLDNRELSSRIYTVGLQEINDPQWKGSNDCTLKVKLYAGKLREGETVHRVRLE